MALFGGKNKEETIVILDFASASVGGMVIKKIPGALPEIIFRIRANINFLMDIDSQAFWRCANNSLSNVLTSMSQALDRRPAKIVCVFSHAWIISQTRIIRVRKDEGFKVDEEFFNKLIDNETQTFKLQGDDQDEISYFKGNSELIEHKIMKTLLNGYPVENPLGKTAKKMSTYVHMSLINKDVKECVEKSLSKIFGNALVIFKTFPFTAFNVLKDMPNTSDGFCFLNIGGEISDISLARQGILEETICFPRGRNFLIRNIAAEFRTFIDDASSMLKSCKEGHASHAVSEKIKAIAERSKEEWKNFLEKALSALSERSPLPKNFFVISGENTPSDFIDCLGDESLAKFTILGKPFEVVKITGETLKEHFKFKRGEQDADAFLMLEVLDLWQRL